MASRQIACAHGNVGQARADVQERGFGPQPGHDAVELGEHGVRAAEQRVRATHVAERARTERRISGRVVEMLETAIATRSKHAAATAPTVRSRPDSRAGAARHVRSRAPPRQ